MNQDVILVAPSLDPNITLGGVSSVARFIVSNNKEVHYIHFEQGSRDNAKGGVYRVARVFQRYREWKKLIKESKGCLIHYNFDLSPFSILRDYPFMRYARKKGCGLLIHVHGGIFMNSSSVPFPYNAILKRIFSWKGIPFVVFSSKEKNTLVSRYGTRNIHVLPNCVDIPSLEKRKAVDDTLKIGYFGRISEAKGMQELLKATVRLKEKHVRFILSFAGKKEAPVDFVDLYVKALGDNFRYDGIVSGQQKDEFLRGLDVFVMPSYFEGLPISLLESMSYGIVPVVTAVGSIPDVVSDGGNGLIVKDHDVDSIIAAIEKLNRDKQLVAILGDAARKTITERFNPQTYVETLNGIYNRIEIK